MPPLSLRTPTKFALAAAATIIATAAIVMLLRQPRIIHPCEETTGTTRYLCYEQLILATQNTGGTKAALDTLASLAGGADFPTLHILLHSVGQNAFEEYGDLWEALEPLSIRFPNYQQNPTLDGYRHGVLQAYFLSEKDSGITKLVRESCRAYARTLGIDTDRMTDLQCFSALDKDLYNFAHGLGHAIMYMDNMDIVKSLSDCGQLKMGVMREACDYGALMELSYLFQPLYHPELPRPSIIPTEMATFCNSLAVHHQKSCARLVGRSYLIERDGDFEGAFRECAKVGERYRSACVYDAAVIFAPRTFGRDAQRVDAMCETATTEFSEDCKEGAHWGMKAGHEHL